MKKNVFGFIFTSSVLTLTFQSAWAADSGIHTRIHHQYQSQRALGMGDAFVAIANDYSALFYNPAGLARREDGQINMSMELLGSKSFSDFVKDLDNTSKVQGTDAQKYDAYNTFLKQNYGKTFMVRAGLFEGIWTRPGWGVGVIPADVTIEYQIHDNVSPAINARVFADSTIAYGYGKDLKGLVPGRLSWGTTAKFVNRGYFNKQVSAFDLVSDSKVVSESDMLEGYTVDFDLGLLYTPELPSDGMWYTFKLAKPTFGAVVRNVLDYGFGKSLKLLNKNKTEAPERLYRVLDLGMKFEYPNFFIFGGRGALDIRDIGHPNFSTRKSLHAGLEFDWTVSSWWKGSYRLGVNQGYPTFGVSALLFMFNLDFVTYGEDVGTFDSPKENRMYALKLNIDI